MSAALCRFNVVKSLRTLSLMTLMLSTVGLGHGPMSDTTKAIKSLRPVHYRSLNDYFVSRIIKAFRQYFSNLYGLI